MDILEKMRLARNKCQDFAHSNNFEVRQRCQVISQGVSLSASTEILLYSDKFLLLLDFTRTVASTMAQEPRSDSLEVCTDPTPQYPNV